jgi:hypothetical protein
VNYTCGFVNNVLLSSNKIWVKTSSTDFHYEYQYDWISGEVPWEFIETEKTETYEKEIMNVQNVNVIDTSVMDVEIVNPESELDSNIIISKAIISGVMKGIYIQIISIDNMITYTQCYTNKIIDMDILLSLSYLIIYEKNKNNEKKNLLALKKYNNIQLFEKYIKFRRASMLVIIIIYVLLFRGISNVE